MSGELRVLIVDDNVDVARTLAALVVQWGHDVRVTHSASQALRQSAEFLPRVAIIDLGLPDLHGYTLSRALRNEAKDRALYVIAITGWSHIADQVKSAASGVHHNLMKPINLDMLKEILGAYEAAEVAHSTAPG